MTHPTDPETSEPLVCLGRITAAHGIRGDVVIKTFTETPQAIAAYGPVIARSEASSGSRILEIVAMRESSKGLIARLKGIGTRNMAESLKGLGLYVTRAALGEPDEGEFFYEDLIGLTAVDQSGQPFGRVSAVENYGAGDILDIELSENGKTEMVPFTHRHVPDVRLADGVIVIDWPLTFEIVQPSSVTQAESDANDEPAPPRR